MHDKFLASYLETALWSSNDESTPQGGEPMDHNYSADDLADETIAAMSQDCKKFEPLADALIEAYNKPLDASEQFAPRDGHLAHDFWLTRNRHGAGFWDGDYPEPLATQLTDLAHSFGERDLYIGDDNKIYQYQS